MTNPLTKDQIELLRSLPKFCGEFDPIKHKMTLFCRLRATGPMGQLEYHPTRVAATLLATIDQMEAEREGEVLAGEYQGGYCVDGETQITVAAVTTSEDINNRKAFESLHAGPCEITIRPIKEGGESDER